MTEVLWILVICITVFIFLGAVFSGFQAEVPPCAGGKTGLQTYAGHVIECFHGDAVEVKS